MKLEQAIDTAVKKFAETFEFGDEVEIVSNGLREILVESLKGLSVAKKAGGGGGRRKTGRHNGYNAFIAQKFKEAKESATKEDSESAGSNSQELMSEFSAMWKTLTDDDKKPYNDLAKAHNDSLSDSGEVAPKKSAKKGKRKLSGYNLFYRENRAALAKEAEEASIRTMTHVGATWKALSDDERNEYNARAKEESQANVDDEE